MRALVVGSECRRLEDEAGRWRVEASCLLASGILRHMLSLHRESITTYKVTITRLMSKRDNK
jgi:hypothetical protein